MTENMKHEKGLEDVCTVHTSLLSKNIKEKKQRNTKNQCRDEINFI